MAKKLISEIFEETSRISSKPERIKYLQENASPQVQAIIRINFDDDIVSLLPEGAPPYNEAENPTSDLDNEAANYKYFFKGAVKDMIQAKREKIFIDVLERIHPKDAKLLIAAKDKTLKYRGITKSMCEETFPNLIKK